MHHSLRIKEDYSSLPPAFDETGDPIFIISCDWPALRAQLMLQWDRLKVDDLDKAGPNRRRIALLIQCNYGIESVLVENYLRNFERIMPLH